jgi:hypothetical protein
LLGDMGTLAQECGEPALWGAWATAATNLMSDLGSRNPEAARALLADMHAVADRRGEPALWEEWAKAAFNLVSNLRSPDLETARAVLDKMRAAADKPATNPPCGSSGPRLPPI